MPRSNNFPGPAGTQIAWPVTDEEPGARGVPQCGKRTLWMASGAAETRNDNPAPLPEVKPKRAKFSDPDITAAGEQRAAVKLAALRTLWFNTGTLCNIACEGCYIESSPTNDRLVYLSRAEVRRFLDEAAAREPRPLEIGFTGGEPFMNPEVLSMLEDSLALGYRVLVLTNAMRPMQRRKAGLLQLNQRFPGQLAIRVSLDHYTPAGHERLRGERSWRPTLEGLLWLGQSGFRLSVAGRTLWGEMDAALRAGYRTLFDALGLAIDVDDRESLVLFPEMDPAREVPEITERCWGILGVRPDSVMCASSRMVVKRKGEDRPSVVACTLLPYDAGFDMGATLADASAPVKLNHKFCAQFCVLGGASCSSRR